MSERHDRAAKRVADARAMVAWTLARWQRAAGKGWRAELLALDSLQRQLHELGSALATGPRDD